MSLFQGPPSTVVCVTDQFACQRLINIGRKIAELSDTDLYVVNVVNSSISTINHNALEFLFQESKKHDAVMDIIYSPQTFETLVSYLMEANALHIVTGVPQTNNSMLKELYKRFPDSTFYTVNPDSSYDTVEAACQTVGSNR